MRPRTEERLIQMEEYAFNRYLQNTRNGFWYNVAMRISGYLEYGAI